MHREFQELLRDATGESQLIIAVNVDVRSYSAFSLRVESVEAALFVKKMYEQVLDEYFDFAPFVKSTGDGLLIVIPFEERTLAEQTNAVVDASLRLVDDFPTLLAGDPLVNFQVPDRLGIGLARGAACRLCTPERTLDYSGKVLNLATRLMDLARPAGVVFDRSFGIELLPAESAARFSPEEAYVRGVAEEKPIPIYFTHELTQIPAGSKMAGGVR